MTTCCAHYGQPLLACHGCLDEERNNVSVDLRQKLETKHGEIKALQDEIDLLTKRSQKVDAEVERLKAEAKWQESMKFAARDAHEATKLQNSALREALAFCVDEYGCSYSAQGEYDGCEKDYKKRKCAICRARLLLHGSAENRSRAFSTAECHAIVIGDADKELCGMPLPCKLHGGTEKRLGVCRSCGGTGWVNADCFPHEGSKCDPCNGTGKVERV